MLKYMRVWTQGRHRIIVCRNVLPRKRAPATTFEGIEAGDRPAGEVIGGTEGLIGHGPSGALLGA
jgi:hypothetical protein